jgi:4'-phosphopantetheinyl transferase
MLQLPPGEVQVWRAWLGEDRAASLHGLLSADEQQRAARFLFPRHRAAYVVARGLLRTLLARYLDTDPSALRFTYNPHGKPDLPDAELRFNLAHSHGLAVYAVSRKRTVGVDVEHVRTEVATDAIAKRHFSACELDELQRVPEQLRTQAFFHAWTRKEAFLKALGTGLALPLDDFDVSLTPGQPALLRAVRGMAADKGRWSLHDLAMPEGYLGALAVEGDSCRLHIGDWI